MSLHDAEDYAPGDLSGGKKPRRNAWHERRAERLEAERQARLIRLENLSGWLRLQRCGRTVREIAERMGREPNSVLRDLRDLADEGQVHQVGDERASGPGGCVVPEPAPPPTIDLPAVVLDVAGPVRSWWRGELASAVEPKAPGVPRSAIERQIAALVETSELVEVVKGSGRVRRAGSHASALPKAHRPLPPTPPHPDHRPPAPELEVVAVTTAAPVGETSQATEAGEDRAAPDASQLSGAVETAPSPAADHSDHGRTGAPPEEAPPMPDGEPAAQPDRAPIREPHDVSRCDDCGAALGGVAGVQVADLQRVVCGDCCRASYDEHGSPLPEEEEDSCDVFVSSSSSSWGACPEEEETAALELAPVVRSTAERAGLGRRARRAREAAKLTTFALAERICRMPAGADRKLLSVKSQIGIFERGGSQPPWLCSALEAVFPELADDGEAQADSEPSIAVPCADDETPSSSVQPGPGADEVGGVPQGGPGEPGGVLPPPASCGEEADVPGQASVVLGDSPLPPETQPGAAGGAPEAGGSATSREAELVAEIVKLRGQLDRRMAELRQLRAVGMRGG